MAAHTVRVGTLTILNNQQLSNILGAREIAGALALIFKNASAYTGAISVLTSNNETSDGSDMLAYQDGGTAVTLAAGKNQRWPIQGAAAVRLSSASPETPQRDVVLYAVLDV